MKKYIIILSLCLMFITISSCNKPLSNLDQVTLKDLTCSINQDQADLYYEQYGKNNSKITVDYRQVTDSSQQLVKKSFASLSNVPKEYLDYVFKEYNIPANFISGSNRSGLTQISTSPIYPMKIIYSTVQALPHEFGHASMGYAVKHDSSSSLEKDLTTVADLIVTKYASISQRYLTSQTDASSGGKRTRRQQNSETFAEIFDTWYCSKAARTNLEKNMPEVYEFAQKYLISPEEDIKDANLYILNSDSNFKIYFSNNKNNSRLSYCINNCSNKITPSSFKNNSNNSNLFEGEVFSIQDSSFTVEVYSEDNLIRKVTVSK